MTPRQRIEAVFRGETPDQMVWFGDLTYWYGSHQKIGDLPERWQGPRGIGQLHREYGIGEYVPGCCAYRVADDPTVRQETQETDGIRRTSWHTPVGSLSQVQEYCPASYSYGYREHAVKSVEDLRIVRYIEERRQYLPEPAGLERCEREYGEFGLPIVAVRASPLFELYKWWIGVMDLSFFLADAPAEVMKTVECMAERMNDMYRVTAESACPYVMLCENLTAETMGGLFDLHTRDYLARQIDLLHRHGKKVIVHIDGTLRGLVEKLHPIGIDCLDAVTPKPIGDVAVDTIRALTGPEILILGGVPGAMFAPPFNSRTMEQHIREIIRIHKDSGRWMFGVADQVPPNGDIHLVKRIADVIGEYGRY